MLLYKLLIAVFLPVTSAKLDSNTFSHASALSNVGQPSKEELHPPFNPIVEAPPPSALRNCPVRGSLVNVRFAAKRKMISAPRMHDMLVKAIVFTNQKKTEGGGGLPGSNFQYDGTGTNKWFYIDVEQTSGGLLTWDNLGRALEGLLICAFHRHIHNEIYFEIWEMDNTEARDILQGIGYFGMLEPAAAVQ